MSLSHQAAQLVDSPKAAKAALADAKACGVLKPRKKREKAVAGVEHVTAHREAHGYAARLVHLLRSLQKLVEALGEPFVVLRRREEDQRKGGERKGGTDDRHDGSSQKKGAAQ